MKILHIVPSYLPAYRRGGPIRSVHDLNKWLVKDGVDVTVYTTNIDGPGTLDVPLGKEVLLDGVKVFYFPISFPRGWQNSAELNKALKAHIKDFDLVHITSTYLAASYFGSRYAMAAGVPYIISPRGNLMRDTYHKKFFKKWMYVKLLEKKALQNAAAIHFTAEAEKEEYLAERLPLKRAIVLPNAVDEESFGEIPEKGSFRKKFNLEKEKIILFLGRISWKKGFDTLIPAMAEIVKRIPNAVLVVAGSNDEDYQKEVERIAEEAGVLHKIRFLGMLLGEDKTGAFLDSDVFVLPSYSENFGNAVTEAMYLGLPVAITKGVAISADIAEAGAGLVTEKETAPFADAVELVLQNREVAEKLRERGKRLVQEKYSWPEIAKKWVTEYEFLTK